MSLVLLVVILRQDHHAGGLFFPFPFPSHSSFPSDESPCTWDRTPLCHPPPFRPCRRIASRFCTRARNSVCLGSGGKLLHVERETNESKMHILSPVCSPHHSLAQQRANRRPRKAVGWPAPFPLRTRARNCIENAMTSDTVSKPASQPDSSLGGKGTSHLRRSDNISKPHTHWVT